MDPLAICIWVSVISGGLDKDNTFGTILYLAPSLLFAQLLGTAAQNPRRPIRAIRAVFERTWDMYAAGRLLFWQILFLLTIFVFSRSPGEEALQKLHLLAQDSSTLSFNPFPLLAHVESLGYRGIEFTALDYALVAASMFVSTVFMHLHFRRVMEVPAKRFSR